MPAELGPKVWTLDYTPDLSGKPDLPQGKITPASGLQYPDSLWDPALRAGLAVTEFALRFATWTVLDQTAFVGTTVVDWNPPNGTAASREAFISGELDYLLALMEDDRDRYMPEILGQADNAPVYWLQLLNLGAGEKPATNALISYAQRVGEIAALYFKFQYKRVRPSALCPGLLLPFGPPRHPAFPSGHSLTGHLTTYLLIEIPEVKAAMGTELDWLAYRVAKNRERAGLHYPSDGAAGQLLAWAIEQELMTNTAANYPKLNDILTAAKVEWQ